MAERTAETILKPLSGVTVVDFTQAYSGPFCTMQLADFGANVIKIERVITGDQSREWAPIHQGGSGYYAAINRNKRGIALDLSSEKGVEVARRLIGFADILVENFKVGTMDKLGLGYDMVVNLKPDIIYASLTGFGQYGPLKNLAAYDNVVQAMSGLMEMTGFPGQSPVRVGPAIGDSFTGLSMSLAILMAYYHKLNTGEGQRLDVAMMDTIFAIMESPILFQTLLHKNSTRCGNNDAETLVPYDVYVCKDGYFSVGLASDSGWPKFCEVIDRMWLMEDPRFTTNELRCSNYEVFTDCVKDYFQQKTRSELSEIFTTAGIPNGPVQTISDIMNSEQLKARGMLQMVTDPNIGDYVALGNPMRLSETPPEISCPSPLLGQHTKEILAEYGYTRAEIDSLVNAGIVQI